MEIKRTMVAYRRNSRNGFTITEVMIAMVIASAIVTTIYQTFHSQQRSYTMQSGTAAMEQNLRSGLYLLTRELRSAGYNPQQTPTDSSVPTTNFRVVTSFPAPNDQVVVNYTTNHSMVAFTLDNDGSGAIEANRNEQIAYKFDNTTKTLQRFNDAQTDTAKKWETVAGNIDAIYFTYFDQKKNITTDPGNMQYIEISLLARTAKPDSKYTNKTVYTTKEGINICPLATCPNGYFGDHYRRRLLTTTIQIRNKLISTS
jgi:prepilin-type N-terminal cleavage/methylation domain-containing protein